MLGPSGYVEIRTAGWVVFFNLEERSLVVLRAKKEHLPLASDGNVNTGEIMRPRTLDHMVMAIWACMIAALANAFGVKDPCKRNMSQGVIRSLAWGLWFF